MAEIKFFVPGMPKTAGSKRVFLTKSGKPIVTDDNKQGKDWRASVQHFASIAKQDFNIMDDAIEVAFTFLLPRPKGHFGARGLRPGARTFPTTKPDVLKLARAAEDALTGILWRDDCIIVDEHLYKRYVDSGEAGCWIYAREIDCCEANKRQLLAAPDGEKVAQQMGLRWM